MIAAAPLSFALAVLAVGALAYFIVRWAYMTVLEHKSAEVSSLKTMVALRDDQLSNKFQTTSPDEAKRLMEALQAQINRISPRALSRDQKDKIQKKLIDLGVQPGPIMITWYPFDDGERLAQDYLSFFHGMGWAAQGHRIIGSRSDTGITLKVGKLSNPHQIQLAMRDAFSEAGIDFEMAEDGPSDQPHIHIGYAVRLND